MQSENNRKLSHKSHQTEPIGNVKKERPRDKQITIIIETATRFGYELPNIPEGGKAAIKTECLKDPSLFTESSFKRAWQKPINAI